jgi:hypothetical protein
MICGATALNITTLSITTFSMTTFSIATFSIATFSNMTFSATILSIYETRRKGNSAEQLYYYADFDHGVCYFLFVVTLGDISWVSLCWVSVIVMLSVISSGTPVVIRLKSTLAYLLKAHLKITSKPCTCSNLEVYSKMSFLVQIKFITDDSEQTHKQILILN